MTTNEDRLSSTQRGYDARWRRLQRMKLRANPLCEECNCAGRTRSAAMVHHIVPIQGRDDPLRLAWDNLMSLCEACHDDKHSGTPEAKRVQGCDAMGMPTHPDHPWSKG